LTKKSIQPITVKNATSEALLVVLEFVGEALLEFVRIHATPIKPNKFCVVDS